jgi:hypothetical protein
MAVARSGWVTLVAVLYLISGVFNLLVGLVALGVTLSGSANVETVYVGDWPTDDLVGAAIVVIVFAAVRSCLARGSCAGPGGRGLSVWWFPRWLW